MHHKKTMPDGACSFYRIFAALAVVVIVVLSIGIITTGVETEMRGM